MVYTKNYSNHPLSEKDIKRVMKWSEKNNKIDTKKKIAAKMQRNTDRDANKRHKAWEEAKDRMHNIRIENAEYYKKHGPYKD